MVDHTQEYERRYAQLSDAELRQIRRHDLGDLARRCYDREVASRGLDLSQSPEGEPAPGELVAAAEFRFPGEAEVARALLESASIPSYLEQTTLGRAYGIGSLRLMVPAAAAEDARAVLRSRVSEQDLDAQARAAPKLPAE